MTSSQFISVRETSQILSISEKKVMELIQDRKLQAYRIADKFLRLKKSEVLSLRNSGSVSVETTKIEYTSSDKFKDFFYFNDFYLLAIAIIAGLLIFILRS